MASDHGEGDEEATLLNRTGHTERHARSNADQRVPDTHESGAANWKACRNMTSGMRLTVGLLLLSLLLLALSLWQAQRTRWWWPFVFNLRFPPGDVRAVQRCELAPRYGLFVRTEQQRQWLAEAELIAYTSADTGGYSMQLAEDVEIPNTITRAASGCCLRTPALEGTAIHVGQMCNRAKMQQFLLDATCGVSNQAMIAALPNMSVDKVAGLYLPFSPPPSPNNHSDRDASADAAACSSQTPPLDAWTREWLWDTSLCLAAARRIRPELVRRCITPTQERIPVHMYWKPLATRSWHPQAVRAIRSFVATQNTSLAQLWMWIPLTTPAEEAPSQDLLATLTRDLLAEEPRLRHWLDSGAVQVRGFHFDGEVGRTPLGLSPHRAALRYERVTDAMTYLEGDLFRLAVLWHQGGVYLDADVLLLRDLSPLLIEGFEWMYPWVSYCDDWNGALMRFERHSDALRALFQAIEAQMEHGKALGATTAFGRDTYVLAAQQVASLAEPGGDGGQPMWRNPTALRSPLSLRAPWHTLPSCLFNVAWVGGDEDNLFSARHAHPLQFQGPFAAHLHGGVWGIPAEPASDIHKLDIAVQVRFAQRTEQAERLR